MKMAQARVEVEVVEETLIKATVSAVVALLPLRSKPASTRLVHQASLVQPTPRSMRKRLQPSTRVCSR